MTSGFLTDLIRSFAFGLVGKTLTATKDSDVEVPTNFRGIPVLDPEKCILCGRCGKVCPAGAITLQHNFYDKKRTDFRWSLYIL